jgi:hypothetical protein
MVQVSVQELADIVRGCAQTAAPALAVPVCGKSHSFEVGKAYLIRTVTLHYTGRVVAVTDFDVMLEDAAWVADTGRYHECLELGKFSEVEPYPDSTGGRVCVCRGAMVDYAPWPHKLPRQVV